MLKTPEDIESVIVDISTGGVRLAVHNSVKLIKGQDILLLARPNMLHREFKLSLHCQVTGPVVPADPKHPQIEFYGVNFDHLSDNELLILHSYVQECLSLETDSLSQVLLLNSKEVDSTD
jgi:c-di-GMP-binding flagellar brake protein YcgR